MGRRKETILRRIARHCGHTEETLQEFLDDKCDDHLLWTGATIQIKPKPCYPKRGGLAYVRQQPLKPVLRGDIDPGRALFCHHHGLDALPSGVWLLPCSERACINPLHREMKATFSRRWEERAELPDIGKAPTQAEDGMSGDLYELADFLRNHKSVARAQTIDEIAESIYTHDEVIIVLNHLGWPIPS